MARWEVLIFIAFATLVCGAEVEDVEQKKRGAGKGTSLNTIPTGAQKQDYTYNIYSQSPNSQTSGSSSYQPQVASSFYPNQATSQYYTTASSQTDTPQATSYAQQPQVNLIPPGSSSQFIPINFVPNPGYQSKYQFAPSKSAGTIQLTLVQPSNNYPTPSLLPYHQSLLAQSPTNPINAQQHPLVQSLPQQGHYNVPNYQPVSLGGSYLGSPSTMLLFAQPNPSLYNNLLYQNPLQSFYNYYPTNSQSKYSFASPSTSEYDKLPNSSDQGIPKDDNDVVAHSSEYTTSSDPNAYKNAYTAARTSYAKL